LFLQGFHVVWGRRFWQNSHPVPNAIPVETPSAPAVVAPVPVAASNTPSVRPTPADPTEFGGPAGPEPTRFGDWEKNGRCVDF
jgi:hypothetical protein